MDFYQSLIESSGDGYAYFEDGTLVYVSPAYSDLLGYKDAGLSLTEILERVHPDDVPDLQKHIAHGRDAGLATQRYRFRARHRDGHYVWLEDVIKRTFNSDGSEHSVMINSRDITQLIAAQQKLESALEEKRALFFELTHRVKNNMAMLAGMLELEALSIEDGAARRIIDNNRERIVALSSLYELMYSRGEFREVDFSGYVERLLDVARRTMFAHHKVAFTSQLSPLDLSTDLAIVLALILHELLVNSARHAFPDAGADNRISIEMNEVAETRRVIIYEDNGVGLPESALIHDTKSFGISIMRDMARQNNLDLQLSNLEEGMRCTITFIPTEA